MARLATSEATRRSARIAPPRAIGQKSQPMPSSTDRLTIALAQIPAIVGDIAGNRDRLRKARKEAAAFGADDGRRASHGLRIHQSEWLLEQGRAGEDGCPLKPRRQIPVVMK